MIYTLQDACTVQNSRGGSESTRRAALFSCTVCNAQFVFCETERIKIGSNIVGTNTEPYPLQHHQHPPTFCPCCGAVRGRETERAK